MDTNIVPDRPAAHENIRPVWHGGPQTDRVLPVRFAWRGIAEATLLIVLLLALDRVFGSGHRSLGVEPHPFGIAVLLVAAQYGTAEAAATALIATAALLAFNLPDQAFDQDHYAWLQDVVRDPLLWLTTSLVVGEITGRTRQRGREAANLASRRESELAGLMQANTELATRVTMLETRIAGQQRTVSSIYEAARNMGPNREAVLQGALALVHAATGATRCSVYLLRGNMLTLVGGGNSDGSQLGAEISADDAFFSATIVERRCLLANNADDRDCLGDLGLMAAPIVTADGAVLGALTVEAIPFTQLHLGTVASFRSVCEWVATGLEQAASYEAAQSGRFLVEGSSLVAARHADRIIGIMGAIARRIGFDLTLMQIDFEPEIGSEALILGRRTVLTVMEAVLRDTDLLIEGDESGRRLCVLMPGTPLRNAPLVAERLGRAIDGLDGDLRDYVTIAWLSLNQVMEQELTS